MATYNMDFIAKIEEIKVEEKLIIVEYFDPHGGDSKRCAMAFELTDTVEDIKDMISRMTPHDFFDTRKNDADKIQQGLINFEPILNLQGETLSYKLKTFDNPII